MDHEKLDEECRKKAPNRKSIMEDLIFYWENHTISGGANRNSNSALGTTFFLQKIIASNYMILVGYLEACLNELEFAIAVSSVEKGVHQILHVSEQWSSLQSWSHRFPEYCAAVGDILRQLKHNLPEEDTKRREWIEDFEGIRDRLGELRARTQVLSESFVGLASMAGIQESLEEAKNVKILTIMGVFFLPLSWISSLFAMNEKYLPTTPKFTDYVRIAFPVAGGLTALVVMILYYRISILKVKR